MQNLVKIDFKENAEFNTLLKKAHEAHQKIQEAIEKGIYVGNLYKVKFPNVERYKKKETKKRNLEKYLLKIENDMPMLESKLEGISISNYIGEVGDRVELRGAVVTYQKFFENRFGLASITKFEIDGCCVNTFTLLGELEVGQVLTIRGTVKEHNEFRGEKQTLLKRVFIV